MLYYLNKTTNLFEGFLLRVDAVKWWKVLGGTILMLLIYNILFSTLLFEIFQVELQTPVLNDLSFAGKIFLIVLVAPLIETIIFQCAAYELLLLLFPRHKILALVISALLFALAHAYSEAYIVFIVFPGLVLGLLYITFEKRVLSPIMAVILVHALINLFALIHDSF